MGYARKQYDNKKRKKNYGSKKSQGQSQGQGQSQSNSGKDIDLMIARGEYYAIDA